MTKETFINPSLQRGDKDVSQGRERFQTFLGKPLKRLDDLSAKESTSLKRGVTEMEIAVNKLAANTRFQNALACIPQATPPIWLMRQAGRYHRHYQDLRRQFSFIDLCKQPELAAHVALGPVLDFDFDAAILFSDLLFPLEALGMGLDYTDAGPQLGWNLTAQTVERLRDVEEAWPHLLFQGLSLIHI